MAVRQKNSANIEQRDYKDEKSQKWIAVKADKWSNRFLICIRCRLLRRSSGGDRSKFNFLIIIQEKMSVIIDFIAGIGLEMVKDKIINHLLVKYKSELGII